MNKKILAVLLALFLTACGGGGSLGSGGSNNSPSLDPAKEVRRIGAITKAALDFGSLFLPITQNYLQARSSSGLLSCPQSGAFAVTSSAVGQYKVTYTQCNVTWTTVNGSIDLTTANNDLIANFDLTWDAVHYQGAMRLMNAADVSPSGLRILGDHATMTLGSGKVYNLTPDVSLGDNNDQSYSFNPTNAIFQDQMGGTLNLFVPIGSAVVQPNVHSHLLDGSGNFVRIDPPFNGNLVYERGNMQVVFDGDITNSGTGFSVTFNNFSTLQNNIASATSTWSAAMANPLYTPAD